MQRTFLSLFLTLTLAAAGCSQSVGPGPAGSGSKTPAPTSATPTPSAPAAPPGWTTFEARDGSFTCAFPEKAENRFQPDPDNAIPGAYMAMYVQPAGAKAGTMYTASWTLTGPDLATPEACLAELAGGPGGGRVVSQRKIETQGKPGVEGMIVRDSGETGMRTVRVFMGKGRRFVATADVVPLPPEGQEREAQERTRTFLDSFQPVLDRAPLEDRAVPIEWKEYKAADGSFQCAVPETYREGTEPGHYSGGCSLPGRLVQIEWETPRDTLATFQANLAKNKQVKGVKQVERNGLKGLEFSTTGDFTGRGGSYDSRVLVLDAPGRRFTAWVQGLSGDPRLEADARKIFDSLKPAGK